MTEILPTLLWALGLPLFISVFILSNRQALKVNPPKTNQDVVATEIPKPPFRQRWEILADDPEVSIYDVIDARLEHEGLTTVKPAVDMRVFHSEPKRKPIKPRWITGRPCPYCEFTTDVCLGVDTVYRYLARPCEKHE